MRVSTCAALLLFASACDSNPCNTVTSDVGDICVPDLLAADTPTVLEIRELCGVGCSHPPDCNATFRNGIIQLDVEQEVCSEAAFGNCLEQSCVRRQTLCKLPALPAGSYTLAAPGSPRRLIRVGDSGVGTCRFPAQADGGT